MSKEKDMYNEGDDTSQVRNIIKHLNEDAPSKEKSREVVVRPDGTKVIRVTKKRRVMVSESEKQRKGRRSLWAGLSFSLLAVLLFAGFLSFRISSMSGESYIQGRAQDLGAYWGAQSVRCVGADMEVGNIKADVLKLEFPEGSCIASIEMSGIKASVDVSTFFSGRLVGDKLEIERAKVVMRRSWDKIRLPENKENDLWSYTRFECKDFSLSFEGEEEQPVSLTKAHAYLYRTQNRKSSYSLILSDARMTIRGWKAMALREAKFLITPLGVEDFSMEGSVDADTVLADELHSSLRISGSLDEGTALNSPLRFQSNNMNFADLSRGRFVKVFTAHTTNVDAAKNNAEAFIRLPFGELKSPEFKGVFSLKNLTLSSFPALTSLTDHLETQRRKKYLPPTIVQANVCFDEKADGAMELKMEEGRVVERDLISLRADLTISPENEISGSLDYGLPARYTHAEYPDGLADPIFNENGDTAWLCTKLSGPANMPEDDMNLIEARAKVARQSRPKPRSLDDVNIDQVIEAYQVQKASEESGNAADAAKSGSDGATQPAAGEDSPAPAPRKRDPLANPLDQVDDPFAPF